MTFLWARVPLWLLFDGGVRSLPAAAQLALIHVAASGGFTRCGEDVRAALDALAAGAGASLDALIDRGLVEHDGTTLRLIPPPSHATPTDAAEDAPSEAPAAVEPPASTPPSGPYRRPSQSPEGQRRRKVLSWFNHRAGPCRDIPKSATWEQWSTSPEGVALLAVGRPRHRGNTPAGPREHGVPAAQEHTGNTAGTHREHPPQTPPFYEETTKKAERYSAGTPPRERGNTPAGTHPPRVPESVPAFPPPDLIGASEVLLELRGSGLRLSATTTHEAELNRALAGVTPAWSRVSLRRLAEHIRADHLRKGWRPTTADLRGRDASWSTLLSLHDEAQDCGRCNGTDDDNDPWVVAAAKKGVKL